MKSVNDLRLLVDIINAASHGDLWPSSLKCQTITGKKCHQLIDELREKYHAKLYEVTMLQVQLNAALREVNDLREVNQVLTDEIDRTKV